MDFMQVKISLKDCSLPVWRRVIMPIASYTLYDLHLVIQAVMGWTDSHLHGFFIDTKLYVDKKAEWEGGVDDEYEDERLIVIRSFLKRLPKQIIYTYDFGDSWDHEIKFERYVVSKIEATYPMCINGSGACPPEDIGGMGGYGNFLEAVKYPKRKANRELLKWYGYEDQHEGIFDPTAFDLDGANSELRESFKKNKRKVILK
ncbi:plasmid pRiA4b ORF-3 family protein [Candidatus Gottesmanbacteria bacterium]|nr:plasmid pRiA4b ORF-3 family protein [Candidatus Gottesmanbacteria bacterium]